MADERDPQVSRRYRELGAEEPPRALDQAILAASRKGLKKRSWYGPVALAASLALVVAVSVQVERQKPDEAVIASAPVQERKEQQAFKAPAAVDEAKPAQKPAPAPQSAEAVRDLAKSNQAPVEERARSDAAAASRPQASAATGARVMGQMQSKVESPDAWLERIAELRKQNKHEEADKALEEFRKRYPDYRLSDEVKAKVERK